MLVLIVYYWLPEAEGSAIWQKNKKFFGYFGR